MIRFEYADWSFREYANAMGLASLFPPAREQVPAALRRRGYRGTLHLVNSGRTALRVGLKTRQQRYPNRKQVLVPSYCCPSIVSVVQELGLIPVPIATGANLNLNEGDAVRRISGDCLALILIHTYGCPAPRARLAAICRQAEVLFVDDAANIVGIRDDLGLLGDHPDGVGILSFNQSKTVTVGTPNGGGALITQIEEDTRAAASMIEQMQPIEGLARDRLYFLFQYMADYFRYEPIAYVGKWGAKVLKSVEERTRLAAPLPAANLPTLSHQLTRLEQIIDGRRKTIETYARLIENVGELELPQYSPGIYLSKLMIKLPDRVAPAALKERLRQKGVRSRLSYPQWSESEGAVSHTKNLIEVPAHRRITPEDARQVVNAITSSLSSAT